MHFFNPVHKMPLVEIIRGEKTSEEAIATTVAYATKLGKTPIVVNDCPGFLVNRVLFPYFAGFQGLIYDGADYQKIDTVMTRFGWPMGPAYLMDVVGMDTAYHAKEVMAQGFPDRMTDEFRTSLHVMYDEGRYGQKTDLGFYSYTLDKRGRQKKSVDPKTAELLASVMKNGPQDIDDQEIIERMMLPMIIETARCFEEGIVDTVNEADMALIMGLGFPPFRGGALRYADQVGLDKICEMADKYAHLSKLYHPTAKMREMAAKGHKYYETATREKSFYKQIDGQKYSRRLLDLADGMVAGKGDGRISIDDANTLFKALENDGKYSTLEKETIKYIQDNYKWTDAADKFLREAVRSWAAARVAQG